MCVDFAQNMDVPHFGKEQPADIYYYSPLTVNIFGCSDLTRFPTIMNAYGYTEAEGGKGSNNVASLIIKALNDFGWLIEGCTGKQLFIVMDNCGGQNKNNNVLRLALYLVELKYFEWVEFAFFICGHTKNDCDHLFNQLKLRWHKSNTYTMGQMVECLNRQPNVNFVEVKSDIFMDYGTLLGTFYKQFPPACIQKNHIFWVESANTTTMHMKRYSEDDDPFSYCFINNNTLHNNRFSSLKDFEHQTLPRPGIKPIKQVKLYKKWRPFVPEPFKDEICPRPPDEILIQVGDERNKKARQRRG